ncbi:MAG: sulfate adenylyltransferase subunit CysN, partial [Halothiobacillus sp.]|nr:sulfate adenylyltransferase subunit CysN [Halothiobacillus sp.]
GDMIVHTQSLPRVSNALKVMVVWMDEAALEVGRSYDIKRATSVVNGHIEHINYRIDVNTYEREQVQTLGLNDIASCKLVLNRPIAADHYMDNRQTGSFIIIDRITNNTVGAGMIVDVAAREQEKIAVGDKEYTQAEIALNAFIREQFPEWGCKRID